MAEPLFATALDSVVPALRDHEMRMRIEARERAKVLEGRHGIRRLPDITFRAFADTYLKDHAELHKRSVRPRNPEGAEPGVRLANSARDHGSSHRAVQA